jgi:hypothetical protein
MAHLYCDEAGGAWAMTSMRPGLFDGSMVDLRRRPHRPRSSPTFTERLPNYGRSPIIAGARPRAAKARRLLQRASTLRQEKA